MMDLAAGPARALVVALVALAMAGLGSVAFRHLLQHLARRTETVLDDIVVGNLRLPTAGTIALGGLWYASTFLALPDPVPYLLGGTLFTGIALLWAYGGGRLVVDLLEWLVRHRDRYGTLVNARTEPVFAMVGKATIYGATLYFVFVAWDIDLTGWLASAGIIGVAVGFASQDTLSNLVAGMFILADGPYKLGDFVVLQSGDRGRVTDIGMLVTRIVTMDDVEVIVPNRMMTTSRILNESGGPQEAFRIRVDVRVGYGTDLAAVRALLLEEARACPHVVAQPAPLARVVRFGEFALELEVLVWCDEPRNSETLRDQLHTRVYEAFVREGVPFPVPRRDVHLDRPASS